SQAGSACALQRSPRALPAPRGSGSSWLRRWHRHGGRGGRIVPKLAYLAIRRWLRRHAAVRNLGAEQLAAHGRGNAGRRGGEWDPATASRRRPRQGQQVADDGALRGALAQAPGGRSLAALPAAQPSGAEASDGVGRLTYASGGWREDGQRQ